MIKRFHVLYVGQIALDNIGLDGTPANERLYPNERLSPGVPGPQRDTAQLMDELGYDMRCGPRNTTSSARVMNACRTWCSSACGWPRRPSA